MLVCKEATQQALDRSEHQPTKKSSTFSQRLFSFEKRHHGMLLQVLRPNYTYLWFLHRSPLVVLWVITDLSLNCCTTKPLLEVVRWMVWCTKCLTLTLRTVGLPPCFWNLNQVVLVDSTCQKDFKPEKNGYQLRWCGEVVWMVNTVALELHQLLREIFGSLAALYVHQLVVKLLYL